MYYKVTSAKYMPHNRKSNLSFILSFIHSFIHSGDLYSASSRRYYSEALPAQSWPKKEDLGEM